MKAGKDYIWVGTGCLIVNEKNDVLLLKRGANAKNEVGYREQPWGAVDFWETLEETCIREIKEELNIEIKIIQPLCVSDHILKKEK